MDTLQTPPDAAPAVPGAHTTHEVRGAVQLVLSGIAVRVVLCGLGGRDVVAAMAGVADLAEIVPIGVEHGAGDAYTIVVGPART